MLLWTALGAGILMFVLSQTSLVRTSEEELERLVFDTARLVFRKCESLLEIWRSKQGIPSKPGEMR